MVTIKEFLDLTSYSNYGFLGVEQIQVLNIPTNAHFHIRNNKVWLGGDFYSNEVETFLDLPIEAIEFFEDRLEIYVRG